MGSVFWFFLFWSDPLVFFSLHALLPDDAAILYSAIQPFRLKILPPPPICLIHGNLLLLHAVRLLDAFVGWLGLGSFRFYSSLSFRLYITTAFPLCQHLFMNFGKKISRLEMNDPRRGSPLPFPTLHATLYPSDPSAEWGPDQRLDHRRRFAPWPISASNTSLTPCTA